MPTALDFLVEDVRLVAAAARAGDLPELRDLDAVLFEGLLAAVRIEDFDAEERLEDFEAEDRVEGFALLRAEVLRDALEREALEREDAALRLDLDGAFLAAVLREAALRAEDFAADLAGAFLADEREVVAFAAVFLAPDLAALVLLVPDLLAPDLDAALRLAVLDGAFLAAVLREAALRVEDFAAVFLAPDLEAVFVPLFAALLRDEVPADFAADLRAVEVPLLALDVPLFLLEELRRALLFFLVLVAPESPVNSIVSGFDFSSVGIAASFKGLRVQPSRFEGNVVIPSGFRLTESVESKTSTFSVDTFRLLMLSGLRSEGAMHPAILLFSVSLRSSRSFSRAAMTIHKSL